MADPMGLDLIFFHGNCMFPSQGERRCAGVLLTVPG